MLEMSFSAENFFSNSLDLLSFSNGILSFLSFRETSKLFQTSQRMLQLNSESMIWETLVRQRNSNNLLLQLLRHHRIDYAKRGSPASSGWKEVAQDLQGLQVSGKHFKNTAVT